jgi:hypothetical protein
MFAVPIDKQALLTPVKNRRTRATIAAVARCAIWLRPPEFSTIAVLVQNFVIEVFRHLRLQQQQAARQFELRSQRINLNTNVTVTGH